MSTSPSYLNGYQILGRMGKNFPKRILDSPSARRSRVRGARQNAAVGLPEALLVVLLAGCGAKLDDRLQSGEVLAWHGLQGRWVGPVVPAEAACGQATKGLMSIGEHGFGFDPFQSTTVIDGTIGSDGHLRGDLVRQSAAHQSLSISFEGATMGSGTIQGTLQSGRCRWTVTLHRG